MSDALLSHCLTQQVDHSIMAEFDALDQAYHHPHVGQHGRIPQTRLVQNHAFQWQFNFHRQLVGKFVFDALFVAEMVVAEMVVAEMVVAEMSVAEMSVAGAVAWPVLLRDQLLLLLTIGGARTATRTCPIEAFLLPFSRCRLIVRGTSLVGPLPPMMLSAAEWASQIPPPGVPRMCEEPNLTVSAVSHTALQFGIGLQDRVERGLILSDKRVSAIVLVPIWPKREEFLDGDDKKARFSVTIWSAFDTPSSYFIDAKASRSRARFFCASGKNEATGSAHPLHHATLTQPVRPPASTQTRCAPHSETTTGKKEGTSSFQVVGHVS